MMDHCANRSRQRGHAAWFALAFLLCGTPAAAQVSGVPPTIAEAHAFLGSTFQRYSISYAVWHGWGQNDNRHGRAGYYGGRDCYSEVGTGNSRRVFAVDWSLISAVRMSGPDAIYVEGPLVHAAQDPGRRHEANFHLYFQNAKLRQSVSSALELLRSSCQQHSKFD